MLNTLIKIIPLDLATTLSPGILALTIILLTSKNHPKAHIIALFLGTLLVGIGINLLGFLLGNSFTDDPKTNPTSAIVDLILGLVLIFYGLKLFFQKERKIAPEKEEDRPQILKWLGLGFIISATNFDALFLSFTAAKETGVAEINDLSKIIFLLINLFFFTLPITLPIFLKLLFPKVAENVLGKINQFVLKYGRYIVLVIFVIFGILLFIKGAKFFF